MSEKKYILIVGASSGIGEEIAKTISSKYNTLILLARRKEKLEEIQKGLKGDSLVYACDVTDYSRVADFFEYTQSNNIKFSGMVYTPGKYILKPFKSMDSGEFDSYFQINLFSFNELCRHFQSPKNSEKGASIVAISSYSAITLDAGLNAYPVSKCALNALVKVLSKELAKRMIRINAILPSHVLSVVGGGEFSSEQTEERESHVALGQIPKAEVAKLVSLLLSDDTKHMTGELLTISAGWRM